ncbi:winged helix DNA-binding domain-containing protein [Actinomadura parmotrematis]|uniref:Winged helix DNA-binding domain-containing protein n=1 Tax=Actinomadura parmotrematis TaxID=2864039 RepID=A0ABS7FXB5_9ACTN|nr:winged helix DNA-binding domain-containing protein [Actinomadura parmotrematis]MBW8484931.1 winged helix DNA-binding domain-containing protein [Actinomadura parmotrematis]
MDAVTWGQVLAWRMRRQFLDRPDGRGPVEVARRLAGVQAQVASAADLAVALRRGAPAPLGAEPGLVKTWAMRGTLHLLPCDGAAAYLALCGTVRNWEKPSWQRTFKATPADLEAIAAAASDALAGGAALTREELTAAIVDATGSSHLAELLGSGWGTLLKPLAWWGVLCFGPPRGARVTFTAPEHRIPGWAGLPDVPDAARTVVRAFLGAHGPATPASFDAWLTRGASRKREVREWFAAAGDLAEVDVEGERMHVLPEHLAGLLDTAPGTSVRLLGAFDQYVLAGGTSSPHLVPPEHRAEVSRPGGWISPVVLHGGRVAGVWADTGDGPAVTPFPDARLPADELRRSVENYRRLTT